MTDSRALLLSHDQIQAIELGARYLSTLAAVERAHMLEDEADLRSVLDGVDPIEVRLTANVLQSLTFLWHSLPSQNRGGSVGAPDGPPPIQAVSSPATAPDGSASSEEPTAPVFYLDPYSRKAPCA